MDEWVKAIITLAGGFVLGIIASFLFRRLSDGTGEGAEQLGQRIDEVVDGITGAEERAAESVGLVNEVTESVDRLSEGSDKSEGAIADAEESVGRIRKLIEEERKRNEKPES